MCYVILIYSNSYVHQLFLQYNVNIQLMLTITIIIPHLICSTAGIFQFVQVCVINIGHIFLISYIYNPSLKLPNQSKYEKQEISRYFGCPRYAESFHYILSESREIIIELNFS